MPQITFSVCDQFLPELDALRQTFSEEPWPDGTSEDSHDADSLHLVASVLEKPVGMLRISIHPVSPLLDWAISGDHGIQQTTGAAELTRAVIAPEWRGKSIYKALMSQAIIWSSSNRVDELIGAVECGSVLLPFLEECGFIQTGDPSMFINRPNGEVQGQVIRTTTDNSIAFAKRFMEDFVVQSRSNGLAVESNIDDRRNKH